MRVAFVHSDRLAKRPQEVYDLIGEPHEWDKWIVFDDHTRRQDLAYAAGFFPSKSKACKEGWMGEPPIGYTEGGLGDTDIEWVCVNVFPHWDDDEFWKSFRSGGSTAKCKCGPGGLSPSCHGVEPERDMIICNTLKNFDWEAIPGSNTRQLKIDYANCLEGGEKDFAFCWINNHKV